MRIKLVSGMITPDGTVLISHHKHDLVGHTDKNGEFYFIDGGNNYIRRSVNTIEPKIIEIFNTDSHAFIREWFEWGSRGKDGKSPLTYIKLKDMETDHIDAVITTQPISTTLIDLFNSELIWRKNL